MLAIAAMEGELDKIVRKILEAAASGDMAAARLVIDKLIPAAKDRPIAISLPNLKELEGCREATAAVIQSVANGELLTGDGERLATMIEFQRKGLEGAEVMRRLDAIEERLNMKEGI